MKFPSLLRHRRRAPARSDDGAGFSRGPDHRPPARGWRRVTGFLLQPILRWRAARIARELSQLLGRGETVLDVGTGDGLVARAIVEASGCSITGVDTVDYGDVGFPCLVYDGQTLPASDESFDTGMALFALHHCRNLEAAFAELRRVARSRIIIIEEVYRGSVEEKFTKAEDWITNRLLSSEVDIPFQFRSLDEWRKTFRAYGLEIRLERRFFPLPFIPLRTVLFVLGKAPGFSPRFCPPQGSGGTTLEGAPPPEDSRKPHEA